MRPILTVVAAVLLTGCGLKDDLYLPEPESEASPVEADTSEAAQENDDGDATNP